MTKFKKYLPYCFLFLFTIIVFWEILQNPFLYTFNFGDNRGTMHFAVQIKNALGGIDLSPLVFTTPLYQLLLFFFSFVFNEVFVFNFIVVSSFVFSWIGAYIFFEKISSSSKRSIIGATFFTFASLNIYTVWINLLGWSWIPFLFLAFYQKNKYRVFLFTLLLCLSGHYFLLIYALLFAFLFVFFLSFSKDRLKLILYSLLGLFLALLFYVLPLSLGGSTIVETSKNLNVLLDGFSFDVKNFILPNNQNFITNQYGSLLFDDFFSSLRYSSYYSIMSLILLFISFFSYLNLKSSSLYFRFLFFFIVVLFLFTLGNSFLFFGIPILDIMPFDIFQYLHLDGIFRKSVYIIYLLNFFLAILIVSLNKKIALSYTMVFFISLCLVLENNLSFNRLTFKSQSMENFIVDNNYVLVLPDTGYSINKYHYLFHKKGQKIVSYGDASNPLSSSKIVSSFDCVEDILFGKIPYDSQCHFQLDFFLKNNISRIFLFKNGYTQNFFWEGNDQHTFLRDVLEKRWNKYFNKTYENQDIVVYSLKNIDFVYSDFYYSDNIYFRRRLGINSPLYELSIKNISGSQDFSFLQSYHSGRKLYLSKHKVDCPIKKQEIYNSYNYLTGEFAAYTGTINLTGIIYAGDTWETLAKKYRLSVFRLKSMNPSISVLQQGKEIVIGTKEEKLYPDFRYVQTGSGNIIECVNHDYSFFQGEDLKYLRENSVFDDTHQLVNDYANGRTLDVDYIKKNFPKEYYKENPDGSIDINLTLYFKPQSYFYLGLGVSGITFLSLITWLLIDWRREKKRALSVKIAGKQAQH